MINESMRNEENPINLIKIFENASYIKEKQGDE